MDGEKLISIVLFAGRDITVLEKCLNSILDYSPYQGVELIVVESTDSVEMDTYIRKLPSIKLVSYADSSSAGERWQKAAELADGERIVFMRDCVLAVPDWLAGMEREWACREDVAIVQPDLYRRNSLSEPWQGDALYVLDYCFMLNREALTAVGVFCTAYQTNEYTVFDLCVRLLKAGLRILNITSCQVQFFCKPEIYFNSEQEKHDIGLFDARNGYKLGYSSVARNDMLGMFDYKKPGMKLLEIGCAAGATLMTIKNANPTACLYGLELSEGAAAVAGNFAEVTTGNFELMERADFEGSFDYVLMGDVLEHLFDTDKALSKVHKWLKPGGSLVVSVPNIAHIAIVLQLLCGVWNYEDSGILDRTHVRFFTEKTLQQYLYNNGYKVRNVKRKKLALDENTQKICHDLLKINVVQADMDNLTTFQVICLAEK